MKTLVFLYFASAFFALLSCNQNDPAEYAINAKGKTLKIGLKRGEVNYLQCSYNDSITSEWPLRYPVYRFLTGDVNNDGQDDIAVGVIKRTRLDSIVRKRLFLFQVRNKTIIPLWLGSSLSHPIEDFTLHNIDSVTVVRAIEKEKSGRYLVAEYEWFGFGLSFRDYLKREMLLPEARSLLDK